MWSKKLKLWWSINWLKCIIIIAGIGLGIMTVYGAICFIKLDEYTKQMYTAQSALSVPIALLHTGVFLAGLMWMHRSGNGMTANAKAIPPEKINVRFSDVIGIEEAKEECQEVVGLIRDRRRLRQIGGKIIKGMLMIGPPGCGKTLLAKAIAYESGIPFLAMAGSEFNEMFVGVGAARVRALFKNARKYAEIFGSCMIFIDEIDAIARGRQFSVGGGGMETNATQNQLLVEMDGLNQGTGSNIIVIGATNAPLNSLDEALLRPGRFDRKIVISKPYAEGRYNIFKYYLSKVKYNPTLDVRRLSNITIGSSPADIENIVKESALIATRAGRQVIEQKDLSDALERISLGQPKKRYVHPKELYRTAVHESGHAILCYFLHPTDDVFKISVVSRDRTLGVMHHQPVVEMEDVDKIKLESEIVVSLGGYAAEKLHFESTSAGCTSDFKWAMKKAQFMVYSVGMGDSGLVGDYSEYEDGALSAPLKQQLNDDVKNILQRSLDRALDILKREKVLLEKMSEKLIEKKTLEYDDVEDLCKTYGVSHQRKIEETGFLQEFRSLFEQAEAEIANMTTNVSEIPEKK